MNSNICIGLVAAFALVLPKVNGQSLDIAEVDAKFDCVFEVKSNVPWVATGLLMEEGRDYEIRVLESICYRDSIVRCDADGPKGLLGWLFDRSARCPAFWNPLGWRTDLGPVKKLRILEDGTAEKTRASFLTLVATIGPDDRHQNAITIGKRRWFKAHGSGELYLFSNDWPGGVERSGRNRFRNPQETGRKEMPTYGNNFGHLKVIVSSVSSP